MEDPENTNEMEMGNDSEEEKKSGDKKGRRKIKIELIEDKSRRHITFSKRKLGIMKKAWELATLTGTQVLLLVASETGHVYTFATPKLQPLITKPEGKNLIQACLNAPDPIQAQPSAMATPRAAQRYDMAAPPEFVEEDKRGYPGVRAQVPYQQGYAPNMNAYQGKVPPGYFPQGSSASGGQDQSEGQ